MTFIHENSRFLIWISHTKDKIEKCEIKGLICYIGQRKLCITLKLFHYGQINFTVRKISKDFKLLWDIFLTGHDIDKFIKKRFYFHTWMDVIIVRMKLNCWMQWNLGWKWKRTIKKSGGEIEKYIFFFALPWVYLVRPCITQNLRLIYWKHVSTNIECF